jgi:hypothetical protein
VSRFISFDEAIGKPAEIANVGLKQNRVKKSLLHSGSRKSVQRRLGERVLADEQEVRGETNGDKEMAGARRRGGGSPAKSVPGVAAA